MTRRVASTELYPLTQNNRKVSEEAFVVGRASSVASSKGGGGASGEIYAVRMGFER